MELNEKSTILNGEILKAPISEKLSNFLRKYTDKFDRAQVSVDTGVGASTIQAVVLRSNALTENNSKAIIELVDIAIKNCEKMIEDAGEAIIALKETLQEDGSN